MTQFINYLLCLFLLLLVACDNAKKEFMTPRQGEIVLDVRADAYSLNGTVIGKTVADISNNDLLIESLIDKLQKIRMVEAKEALRKGIPADESKAKLHIDENLPYDDFYKVAATLGFGGYSSIQYVIGSDFKEPLVMNMPERRKSPFLEEGVTPFRCNQAKFRRVIDELSEKTSHKENLTDEIWDRRIKDTELLIECARRYINLSLSINSKGEGFSYALGLNETGLIDGEKFYTYENLDDVWKFIEDIRLRPGMQDKEDRDLIVVTLENDILVKNLAPVVKKLKSFGYKVHLAILGG